MTRQFLEACGSQGDYFEKKNKNPFKIWSRGVCVPNFGSGSFFVGAKNHRTDRQTDRVTAPHRKHTHVDFEKISFMSTKPKGTYTL